MDVEMIRHAGARALPEIGTNIDAIGGVGGFDGHHRVSHHVPEFSVFVGVEISEPEHPTIRQHHEVAGAIRECVEYRETPLPAANYKGFVVGKIARKNPLKEGLTRRSFERGAASRAGVRDSPSRPKMLDHQRGQTFSSTSACSRSMNFSTMTSRSGLS